MWWPHDTARRRQRRGIGAAALLVLTAFRVHAADTTVALAIVVNGRAADVVARFVMRDDVPHANWETWQACGVRLPAALADALPTGELVGTHALPGVTARIDGATQTLVIEQPPDLSGLTVLDASARSTRGAATSDLGALLNYDVVAQHAASRSHTSALLEARLFGPQGLFESTSIVSDTPTRRHLRLNTSFTWDDPATLRRVRAGDLITGALGWTRPVRLFGLQAMTDFALRPDLVTSPTPLLGGTATLPSTVDVLVNGVRQSSQPVEAGRFEIRQMPVVVGLSEVSVVVRDALGRESVQTLPFYAAPRQLAAGLTEFSVEAGRVRRRFGLESNDYGPLAASASFRAGIDANLTLETHAEAIRGTATVGTGALLTLPGIAALSADATGSSSAGRGGAQFGVGAESQSSRAAFGFRATRASAGFRDVAASQGDAVPLQSLRVNAGWSFGRNGSIGAAFVEVRSFALPWAAQPEARRVLTVSYSVALTASAQVYAAAYRSSPGGCGLSIGLAMPLGARVSSSASFTRDRSGAALQWQASQPDFIAGDVGWRVRHDQALSGSMPSQGAAELAYRSEAARFSAALESARQSTAVRIGAQGSLLSMGGGLHAGPPVTDSLAIVEVQATPGVAVYRENRFVGRTDDAGRIVVPNLLPYQANRISIDPLDLPMDAEVDALDKEVRPGARSGALLRFGVERSRSALVVLHDRQGLPLPLGAIVTRHAEATRDVVGHDGQAYLRGVGHDNELRVSWGEQQRCTARFQLAQLDSASGRVGPIRCE